MTTANMTFISHGRLKLAAIHQNRVILAVVLGTIPSHLVSRVKKTWPSIIRKSDPLIARAFRKYLSGETRRVRLRFRRPVLTAFQSRVLKETARIRYGRTLTYGRLAGRLGSTSLSRACGQALAVNPLPLLIPCHRVVSSDGSPGGFMGAKQDRTGWKKFLLSMERTSHPSG